MTEKKQNSNKSGLFAITSGEKVYYPRALIGAVVSFLFLYCALSLTGAEEIPPQGQITNTNIAMVETASASSPAKIDFSRNLSLDLRDMDIADVLKYIALRSGANIMLSKSVSGRVTFQVKNVPIKDILDVVLLSNGLAYEKQGAIYYVMTDKEYADRYGKSFSDVRSIKMFRLNYAIPSKAFELLDTIKSNVGRILVDQETGTILIMDTPDIIERMENALKTLEERNNVTVFNLQYANAKDVEERLKKQLDEKNVGSISADERSNQVIVQTLPERMNDIKDLITALDKKTKEVLIESRIIQIQLSDDMITGFEWEGIFEFLQNTLFKEGFAYLGSSVLNSVLREQSTTISNFNQLDIPIVPGSTDLNQPAEGTYVKPAAKKVLTEEVYFGVVGESKRIPFNIETLVHYLQTLGNVKFISNPKLAVINNQEARIHVGRREAYITTTTTAGQATTTIAEEVSFVDVGIQLSVTPTINDDGFVTMKVKPEVSRVVDTLVTPSKNKIPIIDTSTAETTIMAKDGSTIIIGGLRGETEAKSSKQVPFLGSIPIIGNLFSSRHKATTHTELIVMLTPTIVTGETLITGDKANPGEQIVKPYRDYQIFEPYEGDKDIIKPARPYGDMGRAEGDYESHLPYKTYRN